MGSKIAYIINLVSILQVYHVNIAIVITQGEHIRPLGTSVTSL